MTSKNTLVTFNLVARKNINRDIEKTKGSLLVSDLDVRTSLESGDELLFQRAGVTYRLDSDNVITAITDDDGNIDAQVILRKGTLASLLAISNAGDGEIAVATDVDAVVVYQGDPTSVGVPYYTGASIEVSGEFPFHLNGLPSTGREPLNITGAGGVSNGFYDPTGIISSATDLIAIPAASRAGTYQLFKINTSLDILAGLADGKTVILKLQYQKVSDDSWADAPNAIESMVINALSSDILKMDRQLPIDRAVYKAIRFSAVHDDTGVSVSIVGSFFCSFTEVDDPS